METNFFYKTKHQKEIQNKTSKGTHVWKRFFVLQNIKIKKEHMHGNELFVLHTKQKNEKTKQKEHMYMETNFLFKNQKEQTNQKEHMYGTNVTVCTAWEW